MEVCLPMLDVGRLANDLQGHPCINLHPDLRIIRLDRDVDGFVLLATHGKHCVDVFFPLLCSFFHGIGVGIWWFGFGFIRPLLSTGLGDVSFHSAVVAALCMCVIISMEKYIHVTVPMYSLIYIVRKSV